MYDRVGGQKLADAQYDSNHVVGSKCADPWRMQVNLLRGYAAFYNPSNLLRVLAASKEPLRRRRIEQQLLGAVALARTVWRLKGHTCRLWRGRPERVTGWPERFRRPGSPYPDLIDSE